MKGQTLRCTNITTDHLEQKANKQKNKRKLPVLSVRKSYQSLKRLKTSADYQDFIGM